MMESRMKFDDVAWERGDAIFDEWKEQLYQEDTMRAIAELIKKHRGGVAEELCAPRRGAFNVTIRLKFQDGGSAIFRIPCPGISMFPEEKVRKEVSLMRYISHHTAIPVPFVLHYGMTDECPKGLGPFIIMEYVEHHEILVNALNLPGLSEQDRPILNPGIPKERLEFVYSQIADILLQLSRLSFDKIGAPTETNDDSWSIHDRALTLDMNELVCLANAPRSKLPSTTFEDSSSYYAAQAEMKVLHLEVQRNDAVDSIADCRRKYIGRHLFRQLASQKLLHNPKLEKGPFRLWCDDLRPGNMLVDKEFRILSVIDWEFGYAAPAEYVYDPPWWLLLETPEYWFRGIEDWVKVYEPRLRTFLKVLEQSEQKAIEKGTLRSDGILSQQMRENWENGQFWIDYAARKSWAFDSIFWKYINPKFFGGDGSGNQYEARLEFLSAAERKGIDDFVMRKMEEAKARTLASHEI